MTRCYWLITLLFFSLCHLAKAQGDDCLFDPAPQLAKIRSIAALHPGAKIDPTGHDVTFTLLSGLKVSLSYGGCDQFGTSVQLEGHLLSNQATEKELFAMTLNWANEYWESTAVRDLERALHEGNFDVDAHGGILTYQIRNENYTAMYIQYEYSSQKLDDGRLVLVYYFG